MPENAYDGRGQNSRGSTSVSAGRSGGSSAGRGGAPAGRGDGDMLGGLRGLGEAIRSMPGNIARDVKTGFDAGLFAGRDKQAANLAAKGYNQAQIKDYFDRTDATIARNAERATMLGENADDEAIRQRLDMTAGDTDGPRLSNPAMQYRQMLAGRFGGMQGTQMPTQAPVMGFGENALTILPSRGEVTPDMRREALRIFESQRGAGQIPYQMLPYQQGLGSMQPNPNVSPAFQYAAQNYQRLGGAQRLMDRPMEMMSVAERQRINEMAQGMADMQRPTMFPGKGAGTYQPETLNRMLPLIGQMGIAGLRGTGRPMSGMQNGQRSMQGMNPSFRYIM